MPVDKSFVNTGHGIILKGVGGLYEIMLDGGVRVECRGRGAFRHERLTLLPGDRVTVADDGKGKVIDSIDERKTVLIRPAIANLDLLFLVIPTSSPAPSLLTCDKLTAICEHNGIDVKVVVSKADLDRNYAEEIAAIYSKCGFETYISGRDTDPQKTRDMVFASCDGRISAFAGASGVGKSTLMNSVFPGLGLETGNISRKVERGRHTTRKAELYALSELTEGRIDGYLADTPGFSMLDFERFDFFTSDELFDAFREFAPCAGKCRYTKCTHTKEEGCEVLRRVGAGEIPASRHESYLELYSTLKNKHSWDKS